MQMGISHLRYTMEICMTGENERIELSEEELRKFVVRAIGRVFHNIIDTFETHDIDKIPIDWMRDYIDNIVETFPYILPEDIQRDK